MIKIKSFLTDVRAEMKKVEWPSRAKVSKMTAVVLVVVVVMTAFTFVADLALGGLLFR